MSRGTWALRSICIAIGVTVLVALGVLQSVVNVEDCPGQLRSPLAMFVLGEHCPG